MKCMLLVAAASVTLFAGAAFAESEGGHTPFDYATPGVVTIITPGRAALAAKGQDPFPFRAEAQVIQLSEPAAVLPSNGSDGAVQTANSLPRGFSDGTAPFEQRRRVLAFLKIDAARQAAVRIAQEQQQQLGRRG